MRIISCGDIHMATSYLHNINEFHTADLILINGDLTNYGHTDEVKQVLDEFLACNRNVLAQLGNLDHFEVNSYLEQLNMNMHHQARLFHNRICLVGIGGSNKTPFNTPTEFSEQELEKIGEEGFAQAYEYIALAEPLTQNKIPVIFITHTPPADTAVDIITSGGHVGSQAIRRLIEKHQPDLCISGHIHEAVGQDQIGKTPIFNPGMLSKGGWIEICIDQEKIHATLNTT